MNKEITGKNKKIAIIAFIGIIVVALVVIIVLLARNGDSNATVEEKDDTVDTIESSVDKISNIDTNDDTEFEKFYQGRNMRIANYTVLEENNINYKPLSTADEVIKKTSPDELIYFAGKGNVDDVSNLDDEGVVDLTIYYLIYPTTNNKYYDLFINKAYVNKMAKQIFNRDISNVLDDNNPTFGVTENYYWINKSMGGVVGYDFESYSEEKNVLTLKYKQMGPDENGNTTQVGNLIVEYNKSNGNYIFKSIKK